jgi:Tfp pilus assembly protein PilP
MMKLIPILFVLSLLTFGCQKEKPHPVIQKQTQKAQKPETAIETTAPLTHETNKVETAPYFYEAKGRRDPFLSIIEAAKKDRAVDMKKKGAKPTESFDVADIRVIAIASDKQRFYAMVQLPDKKYFTVKEGMTLGLYGGKVMKIDAAGMVVREFMKDFRGEIKTKDTILKLRKEEGE